MYAGLFTEFTLHLAFGLCLALFFVSRKLVTSGFFRIQMWIVMGLDTFAGILCLSNDHKACAVLSFLAAASSYFSAVFWLYERTAWGMRGVAFVLFLNLVAFIWMPPFAHLPVDQSFLGSRNLAFVEGLTSGSLLGFTVTAMLLGHWYLNVPGMKLQPLQTLLVAMSGAVILRAAVGIPSLWEASRMGVIDLRLGVVLSLRWIAGLIAVAVLCYMAWQTLRIPNTQSATGILYVAVILVFLGELSSHLLAKDFVREGSLRLSKLSVGKLRFVDGIDGRTGVFSVRLSIPPDCSG